MSLENGIKKYVHCSVNKPVEFPHKYVGSCCPLEREEDPFEISESKG